MKKGILILLGMFMMVSTVEAKNGNELPNRFGVNYAYDNTVNFIENGVEFFIFTNGEFDFDTNLYNNYYNYNGIRVRNRAITISRDFRGRINRIGTSFINYDRFGNVTRIGNVFMRYQRGRLTNVGNLRVRYNRIGNPVFYGTIRNNFHTYNGIRFNLNIGDIFNYNDAYFTHRDFRRNYSQIREDRNFFYYRANTNANIGKRSQILRRRKPAALKTNRRVITNTNRSNTYRKPATTNSKRTITTERRSSNSNSRKPIANVSKRKVITEKRNTNSTYRKPVTTKRKVESTTKRKIENTNRSERKRRN